MSNIPDYLSQGEAARLFPVLSTTSKEGRATSILLSSISNIFEFGQALLSPLGQRLGSRAKINAYTEVVFGKTNEKDQQRPDGLITVRIGSREWRAIVEAKVGNNKLDCDQIERYQQIAKQHNVDCVITISNQFATSPQIHPLPEVRKNKSKVPVFHWSWMYILTTADLLINNDDVADADQMLLLNELRRFLSHESTGVKGFERMPPEWTEINRLVSAGGKISIKSTEAVTVLDAWHQEMRDLGLILSRQTETFVLEKMPRKYNRDQSLRIKDELKQLKESDCLTGCIEIKDSAGPLDIVVDISRRTIEVGTTLKAPEDKVSSRARVNWLLRQVKSVNGDDVFVRLNWPGSSEATHLQLSDIRDDISIVDEGKENLQVRSFHIYYAKRLGARFTQRLNFIVDLERIVPYFYKEILQNLVCWQRKAPKIKLENDAPLNVSVDALSVQANDVT